MGRARHIGTLLVVALLGVVACTGSSGPMSATAQGTAAGPLLPEGAGSLPGSLLVLDDTGTLTTMRPDGTARTTLAVGAAGSLQVIQAAWAPDGSRVAWSQIDLRDGTLVARLITSGPAGERRVETLVDPPPFYLAWDPTSRHVAYLGNAESAIALGVVEAAATTAAAARPLDEGSPYYFSWGPDGDRMLVHVGTERLDELTITGEVSTVDRRPGRFQAPVWSADGSAFVYARRDPGSRQRIVVLEDGGRQAREVATAQGYVSLVLSPDGSRLAYQALGTDELNIFDPELPERATDVGVRVVDVESGRVQRVSRGLAHAWFWSPDGSRLAILEPISTGGDVLFRWRIWDGTSSFATAPMIPAAALLQSYTPFFSQHAQSSTIWAPDGSAFAFPAQDPTGSMAILVQPALEGAAAYPVAAGSFVVWSPV